MSEVDYEHLAAIQHQRNKRYVLYLVVVSPTAMEVEQAAEFSEMWHVAAARTYLYRSANQRLRNRVQMEMLLGHPVDVYGIDLEGGEVAAIKIAAAGQEDKGNE